MTLNFNIENKRINALQDTSIVSDNGDYVFAFSFDGEWDGAIKTARISNGGKYVDVVLNKAGEAKIPSGILYPPCVTVGVYASGLRTSTVAQVKCEPSVFGGEKEPLPPEDGVYNEIIQLCEDAIGQCEKSVDVCRELSERYDESAVTAAELEKYANARLCYAGGQEAAPKNGIFPCEISKLIVRGNGTVDSAVGSIKIGEAEYPFERQLILRSLGGSCDEYDVIRGEVTRRIAASEVIYENGSLYCNDSVYGKMTRAFSVVSHEPGTYKNTECVKVNKRYFQKMSVTGCFSSPSFVTNPDARNPEKAVAGQMYGGGDDYVYFTIGEAGCDGVSEFKSLCVSMLESGCGLKLYYEYSQPVTEACSCSLGKLTGENDTVSCHGNEVELGYRGDTRLDKALYGKSVYCFSCSPVSWATQAVAALGGDYREYRTDGQAFAYSTSLRSYTSQAIRGSIDGDIIIFDDGICDSVNGISDGEISDGYGSGNDMMTSAGGLEELLYKLITKYPEKRYGMVFTSFPDEARHERRELFKKILEKWGISYIDIFSSVPPIGSIPSLKEKYTPDGIHPNEACIKAFYVDRLMCWLKMLSTQ